MKVVPLGQAKNELSSYVEEAQRDHVLVTRHGKPAAIIIGVVGQDFEDLMTRSDPEFWELIKARRASSKAVSSTEARRRLGVTQRRRPKRKH
jgi:prevent-host-death family protein